MSQTEQAVTETISGTPARAPGVGARRSESARAPDGGGDALTLLGISTAQQEEIGDWLNWQCRMFSGALSGAVFFIARREPLRFVSAAHWSGGGEVWLPRLEAAAEKAVGAQTGIVRARQQCEAPEMLCDLIACPLFSNGKPVGVVALALKVRTQPQQKTVLQLLQWGGLWLENLLRQARASRREQAPLLVQIVGRAMQHRPPALAATEICNQLADVFSCDRVSIGFMHGLSPRVGAVSHRLHFERRAPLLQALEAAMEEAVDQRSVVAWPNDKAAGQLICRAHAELGARGTSGAVCTVPLEDGGTIMGAITLERAGRRPFDNYELASVRGVAQLAGPLLALKLRETRPLARHLLDAARERYAKLRGTGHIAYKIKAGALAVAIAALLFVPTDYRIKAPSALEGTVQQVVVAPQDGFVAESGARAGDLVHAGDVLARLDTRELALERRKWQSEREKHAKEYQEALAKRDRAQISILGARMAQADAQLSLLDEQLRRAELVAPFDGILVTGDLSQSLGAPVERGQLLFEVAPLDTYQVVLQVAERDIAWVRAGQTGTLRLAGLPSRPLKFTVSRVLPVAEAKDGRNSFRVEGTLDADTDRLRPGMQGVAKVAVDRGSLLSVWTRPLTDRLRLWFWSLGL